MDRNHAVATKRETSELEAACMKIEGNLYNRADEIVKRLEGVLAKLRGAVPTPVSPRAGESPPRPPLLSRLREGADSITERFDAASSAVTELENLI